MTATRGAPDARQLARSAPTITIDYEGASRRSQSSAHYSVSNGGARDPPPARRARSFLRRDDQGRERWATRLAGVDAQLCARSFVAPRPPTGLSPRHFPTSSHAFFSSGFFFFANKPGRTIMMLKTHRSTCEIITM